MSSFPGRRGKKGKGRNRFRREKVEHANGESSSFQSDDHQTASIAEGSTGANKPANRARKNARRRSFNGQDSAHFSSRNENYDGGENGVERSTRTLNNDFARIDTGKAFDDRKNLEEDMLASSSKASHKRRKNKRKSKNRSQSLEGVQRHLRKAVEPIPVAAYSPVEGPNGQQEPAAQSRRPKNNHRHPYKGTNRQEQGLYAALDLGTNNCRLLVAVPQERGRFRVVDGFSKIVRLGEGLAHSGRLSDEAMDRAVQALKICAEKMISHNIKSHRLIATEACRQASNGAEFLQRVKEETGMTLEIIDRQTEAYLAAEGCGALMDRKADAAVLFDIGGGSSELVLVNRQRRKKRIAEQIVSWTSVPIGVVTLAERHGGKDVNKDSFQSMIAEVKDHLEKFEGRNELARIWKNGRVHLLGTSGTVTTLAGIHLKLPKYERRLVDGLWLSSEEIDTVIDDLLAMDYRQRANSPCIGTERADLVMAGCAILEAIRQTWPSKRLRVADRGLREGILTQLIDQDSAWLPNKSGRWRRSNQYNRGGRNRKNSPSESANRN